MGRRCARNRSVTLGSQKKDQSAQAHAVGRQALVTLEKVPFCDFFPTYTAFLIHNFLFRTEAAQEEDDSRKPRRSYIFSYLL
ncbi:hypothetical protein MTR_1g028770 [Medicago truncatula]|uniref:Uncharacterized protein n=1 Tax=Medicago truncatula TaxID=3880 RepID=A0A072VQN7_MEDTR|nr:hypothetical protein MTR_1g028770 [Medicago truncatula]